MDAHDDPPPAPLESGDPVELRIDALSAGGDGVGRLADGRVVFVPLTAPGDRVRARLASLRPRFARAELEEVLEPGPSRVAPRCPVFGVCGGCAWQHVAYEAQCEAKRAIVEDALRRIGRLAPPPVTFRASPEPYAYRSRTRVLVERGRVGYRRRKSHALCAVESCPVLTPPVDAALRALADAPPKGDGEWELAAAASGVAVHPVRGAGKPVEIAVDGGSLRASPGVFFQAHAGLHEALVEAVAEDAGAGGLALELFAGAGFFTLRLARAFARVVAVEAQAEAAEDLRHNLARAGCEAVRVVEARVEAALEAPDLLGGERPDVVVLDPPRAGLAPGAAERIAALAPRRIVYLSCDPATHARDLAVLTAPGFALERVQAFDLFPQTPHVEALARLGRVAPEA
jgi:23S rRNA (uracil1939-C5)-methyltransferase